MGFRQPVVWVLALMTLAASGAWGGDQPTTPTRSITDDLADLVRERLGEYQPLLDQVRKRSGSELQKLQQWEYKVVTARTADPDELTALLNEWGAQGWECFHVASGAPAEAGGLPLEHLLFLRKRKGSWLAQVPLRDILRLLLFLSSEPGEVESVP